MNSSYKNKALITMAGVVLLGCIVVISANLLGIFFVEKHDPISETISTLAIGKYAWIVDLGLDAFAVSLLSLAIGFYFIKFDSVKWKVCIFLLVLLSIDIYLISEHNEYADSMDKEGRIHIYCVYFLGACFSAITLLCGQILRDTHQQWSRYHYIFFAIWSVFAPLFFFVPTSIDGLYERGLAIIMVGWVISQAWFLYKEAR